MGGKDVARSMAEVTAVILAGGFGTRLKSVVKDRPKVLALVGGRPFMEYLFDRLILGGISKAILCTGYMAEKVEALYGDSYQSLKISYSREDTPKGTGGALRDAASKVTTKKVLVLNGDSVADVNIPELLAAHQKTGAKVSMVVFHVPDVARYGSVAFDETTRQVHGFKEKKASSGAGWINAGVYLIEKDTLSTLSSHNPLSLESEGFSEWIRQEIVFCMPVSHGTFIDIGTPDSYAEANTLVEKGEL